MNYRHAYHAGNFADVVKHVVLVLCLDYLRRKDAGFRVIDAHAGAGLYDLSGVEAQKTGEWEKGVGRLASLSGAPADLRLYLDAVEADLRQGRYPGSPLIAARGLRAQDRLHANELHGETCATLRDVLADFAGVRVTQMDAYEALRAHLPPPERRGLALIDPPFEDKREFDILTRQMDEWKKRWATGTYLVWYPIKATSPIEPLKQAAAELNMPRSWCLEAMIRPRTHALTFNGCGLILFNAPYTVPERIEALAPVLQGALALRSLQCTPLVADQPVR